MNETACSRRGFLKAAGVMVGASVAAPVLMASEAKKVGANLNYPSKKVASLSSLKASGEIDFNYPDADSPCKAVIIDGKVKAYSVLCTHKGCPTMYNQSNQTFECPCHFSKFDAAKDGQMVIGQATAKLPQILVEVKGDDVIAYGVDGLIFGRISDTL